MLGLGLTARPQAHEAWVLNFCILGPHVLVPRVLGPLILGPHVLGPLILDPHDLGSWAPGPPRPGLFRWLTGLTALLTGLTLSVDSGGQATE